MRILISGGAGFIGANLSRKLLSLGNEVIVVDNLISGSRENIKDLEENPLFTFYEIDINEKFDVGPVDEIFHLASIASVYHYINNPIETLQVGSVGTYNLLEYARRYHSKLLFTSTSEVYGNPEVHPQKEDYWGSVNPVGVRSCYDESKRFGEAMVMAFYRKYGVDTKIARIFNTYGPYMKIDDKRVISNFIIQALQNKPLTIYGDGKQTRSFCYIDDTVDGLLKLMEANYHFPVNIGNSEEYTILNLAGKIIDLLGVEKKLVYKQALEDDPQRRRPDISLAIKLLNWQPQISLERGLKRTIEWFRRKLQL